MKKERSIGNVGFVFLDRDGVINRKLPEGEYVSRWAQFEMLPRVAEAIAKLNQAGIKVIVVSNQRGIALGKYDEAAVEAIHHRLQIELQKRGGHIDRMYFCPHDRDSCDCRKPKSGMFLKAFKEFEGCTPATSVVIGDSLSDIEAGNNLQIATIYIEGDPATKKGGSDQAAREATATASSLYEAVTEILLL